MSFQVDRTLRQATRLAAEAQPGEAAALYLKVLTKFPANRRAKTGLLRVTRLTDGDTATHFRAECARVNCLLKAKQVTEALEATRAMVQEWPHVAAAHYWNGLALKELGKNGEATVAFRHAHKLDPDDLEIALKLGTSLASLGLTKDARDVLSPWQTTQSENASFLKAWAHVLILSGDALDAIDVYQSAAEITPDDPVIHANLAKTYSAMGRIDEAKASMAKAHDLSPSTTDYALNYSTLGHVARDDPMRSEVEKRLTTQGLTDRDRMLLQFALAKMCHDTGEVENAFAAWAEANAIHTHVMPYNPIPDVAQTKALKLTDPPEPLRTEALTSRIPIFIVGMPRSGTSLMERILGQHPDVYGAGERRDFPGAAMLFDTWRAEADVPTALTNLRTTYLNSIAAVTPEARYIVDKQMLNFWHIDLIKAALPEARILHVTRDPRASCWSIFRRYFPTGGPTMAFGYSLLDLAGYWSLYNETMAHWVATAPQALHTISHEALCREPDHHVRALIDTLDLPWDRACLSPHASQSAVMTASAGQVHQPISAPNTEEWQLYQAHLEPLLTNLPPTEAWVKSPT